MTYFSTSYDPFAATLSRLLVRTRRHDIRRKNKKGIMLNNTIFRVAISIVCLLTISGIANADTKVKTRQTSGGQTYENATYIKGKRQRTETNNGQMIMLQQCDLRRNIQIMPQAQAYVVQPYDQPATSNAGNNAANAASPSQPNPVKKGGVVTSVVTTKDTGERKQMFGYTARHIITTMVMDSSPDACSPVKNKMQIDGWYIDAAFALECDSSQGYTNYRPQASGGCQDRYETKQIGMAKKGFPVWEKMTMFGPDGAESFATVNEVVEFSQATLEASLFDVPAGYREVKDFASAFSGTTEGSESGHEQQPASNPQTPASNPQTPATPATPATQQNTPPADANKKQENPVKKGLKSIRPKW